MADFKVLMKDVTGEVEKIKKSTKDLLADYKAERKEAARYWAGLGGKEAKETSETSATEAPKRKRGRRKK